MLSAVQDPKRRWCAPARAKEGKERMQEKETRSRLGTASATVLASRHQKSLGQDRHTTEPRKGTVEALEQIRTTGWVYERQCSAGAFATQLVKTPWRDAGMLLPPVSLVSTQFAISSMRTGGMLELRLCSYDARALRASKHHASSHINQADWWSNSIVFRDRAPWVIGSGRHWRCNSPIARSLACP